MRFSTALLTVLATFFPVAALAQEPATGPAPEAAPAEQSPPPSAQDGPAMDPPPGDTQGNPQLELAPPVSGNPPQVDVDAEKPGEESEAAAVARDAALGGWGVLGPFGMLGFVQFVSPVAGAITSGWASQQQGEDWGGQWVRGLATAATELAVGTALSVPILVALLSASLGLLAVSVVSAILVPLWAGNTYGFSSPQFLAAPTIAGGASLVVAGLVYLTLPVGVALWSSFAAWAAAKAATLVWDRVWSTPDKRGGLRGTRVPGVAPLEKLPSAGVVAAAYAGAEDQARWVELLPVLGPWMMLAWHAQDGADRAHQARRVTGWESGADVSGVARTMLAVRAFLQSGGMVLNLALAALMVALGAGLTGAGVWMLVSGNVQYATAAGVISTIGSLLLSSVLGLGGGMFFFANVLRVFTPWAVASRAMWDASHDGEETAAPAPAPADEEGTTAKDD